MSQRKKLNALNESEYNIEEKYAKITDDGKQLLVRIPKEIVKLKDIKKGDKIMFKMEIPEEPIPVSEGKLEIKYVKENGKR